MVFRSISIIRSTVSTSMMKRQERSDKGQKWEKMIEEDGQRTLPWCNTGVHAFRLFTRLFDIIWRFRCWRRWDRRYGLPDLGPVLFDVFHRV